MAIIKSQRQQLIIANQSIDLRFKPAGKTSHTVNAAMIMNSVVKKGKNRHQRTLLPIAIAANDASQAFLLIGPVPQPAFRLVGGHGKLFCTHRGKGYCQLTVSNDVRN